MFGFVGMHVGIGVAKFSKTFTSRFPPVGIVLFLVIDFFVCNVVCGSQMIRVSGWGDIMLCFLLLTGNSGQASEPSLARLVYFDELDRVLASDIKSCWVSDQPDSGCLFQQVGSDLALAKSAISSNTVPIMDTALF